MKFTQASHSPLPKTLWRFFFHFLKPEIALLLIAQFCAFAWSLDSSLWPYIIQHVIDTLTTLTTDRSQIWSLLSGPIAAALFLLFWVECSMRCSGFIMSRLVPRLEAAIRMEMFAYLMQQSFNYFSDKLGGSLAKKIDDMATTVTLVVRDLIFLFIPTIATVAISASLFAYLHPSFSWLLLTWFTLHSCICIAFAKRCNDNSRAAAEAQSSLSGAMVDIVANSVNVKLFASRRFETHYLQRYQRDEQQKQEKAYKTLEWMRFALGMPYIFIAVIAFNGYLIYSWQHEQITTGEFIFIFNSIWNISMMTWMAGNELPTLYRNIGICRQALSLIEDEPEVSDTPGAIPIEIKRGEILFDKVNFHYNEESNLFKEKSVKIAAKEKVGLVGYSGSGKTTFVNLILRFFDLKSGEIFIDGQAISNVTQESLRSQIAVIPQDPILFHRTLMENIRYGRLDATDEEVIEAAKRAHCDQFIREIPENYRAMVGERGVKLSGGQRQRIAIARALLKNAPLLILDEATSMLDSVTEGQIQAGLKELMAGRTVIVIAHRLSTLAGMDRILVFSHGEIIEEGTHDQLIQIKGHYANMWAMQAGGFLNDKAQEG